MAILIQHLHPAVRNLSKIPCLDYNQSSEQTGSSQKLLLTHEVLLAHSDPHLPCGLSMHSFMLHTVSECRLSLPLDRNYCSPKYLFCPLGLERTSIRLLLVEGQEISQVHLQSGPWTPDSGQTPEGAHVAASHHLLCPPEARCEGP